MRAAGHPWDRRYSPDETALDRVRALPGAECFIVDEGPGLSGSTFLAIGEGLERAGVPRDSAWDLAAAMLELELSVAESQELLAGYRRRTGDDARARLPAYGVAYTASRIGYLNMAASAAEPLERQRLVRDCEWSEQRVHLEGQVFPGVPPPAVPLAPNAGTLRCEHRPNS